MSERPERRRQWHPLMVEGLRYLMEPALAIQEEDALSALPTRADVRIVRRDPGGTLAFPYDHLGTVTLVELEGPGRWASWRALNRLYDDWVRYRHARQQRRMDGVALWLVVSRVSGRFLGILEQELRDVAQAGPGLWRGSFQDSLVTVVDLGQIPITVQALPLLMAYKGPREREIAAFVLAHAQEHRLFVAQVLNFHARAVKEVLEMNRATAELYREVADIRDFIDLWGTRILVEEIGEDEVIREIGGQKFIREIGEEKIIGEIGEERVVEDLLRKLGPERLQELIDRKRREQDGNGEKPGSPS